jgi:hypothetical chaperone protein
VIDGGVGFTLYEAVEAVKRRLSSETVAELTFDYPGAELEVALSRDELEQSAERALDRITGALDATVEAGGLGPDEVDILCVTGGTSRMPLVLRALQARLPRARLRRLRSFHSVVQGLARRAREMARA